MRSTIILASILLLTGTVSAQTTDINPETVNPSVIGPDSFFYPLQLGVDALLNSPAKNAVKRAKDARISAEKGDFDAADRALEQLSRTTNNVEGSDQDKIYLDHAQKTINEIEANKFSEKGLDTASKMISEAKLRNPIENGEKSSGFLGNLPSQARESTEEMVGNRP